MKKAVFLCSLLIACAAVLICCSVVFFIVSPLSSEMPAQLLTAFFFGFLASLCFAWIAARFFSQKTVGPVHKIAGEMARMQNKSGEMIRNDTGYTELDSLVDNINALTLSVHQTLSELSGEREKLDFLLNNMIEGMVVVDANLKIINVNTCALRLFGKTQQEVYRKNILNFTDKSKIITGVEQAVSKQAATSFETHLGPEHQYYLVHITPVKSNEKEPSKPVSQGAIILMSDVTASKKAEHMRTEFFANASHELKTPITTIQGFAEILANGIVTDPEKIRDFLNRITDESKRMSSLINDILKISALEAREQAEDIEQVDLHELAEDISENLTPQSKAKSVTIEVSGQSSYVFANRQDMMQLEINLIENAVKYNVPGGHVFVTVMPISQGVVFKVKDTGIGIPKQHQSRVFERFYRVDKGRSRNVGGTGLGLAIVKHVAALYKAQIEMESAEGVGTEISVVFPEQKAPPEPF